MRVQNKFRHYTTLCHMSTRRRLPKVTSSASIPVQKISANLDHLDHLDEMWGGQNILIGRAELVDWE